MYHASYLASYMYSCINDNNLEDDQELLALTTYHVAMMIATKNGALTTVTASMTTARALAISSMLTR